MNNTEAQHANTYSKYVPNVFLAKCTQQYNKGEVIPVTTKYGKENDCIVFNLIGQKDGFYYYSIVRADGFNVQEYARKKAEKLQGYAANAEDKSTAYWNASHEGRDFLALGEPIKVGHHSERRHRRLIERNWERMGKSVAEAERAKDYENRSNYWADKANKIDLSMPESLAYFEFELEKAIKYHQYLKDNPNERRHSMSLQYANKAVNDTREKTQIALKLWGDEEDIKIMEAEKQKAAEAKAAKSSKKNDIVEKHNGFFAFNTEQLTEGIDKLKADGILLEGDKVCHVGYGLYIPKKNVDSFLMDYKK